MNELNWKDYKSEPPPMGEEVLAFHKDWIDEDFNPTGIRIGFQLDDGFTSAHWWSYQDCYMTISHIKCDGNSAFSQKTQNSIDPEKWISLIPLTDLLDESIPVFPPDRKEKRF